MIRIACDMCGAIRSHHQPDWILGYDLSLDTPETVSRSISFFDRWDDSRILQRGAIHFCSAECKQAYVAANTSKGKASLKEATPVSRRASRTA
jgi:hypothetical protein